jgi:TetR/AcrR family transcriptional regulator
MPTDTETTPTRRDAAASRERILDAATVAFARDGFDGATMGRIATEAGVSSALPAYFFADKRGLHDAVLERQYARREAILRPVADDVRATVAAAAPLDEPALRRALNDGVGGYVGFLAAHPEFVRLMAWEALNEGRRTGPARPPHSTAMQDALDAILAALAGRRRPPAERRLLLITLVGLCFFPDAHADTMLAGLGIDAREPRFRAARVRHVVDVLVATLQA